MKPHMRNEPDLKARSTIRRLVQKIAENIDPNVEVEAIKIGESNRVDRR